MPNADDVATSLTMDEAATLLRVSRSTLNRMVREQQIDTIRVGGGRGRPRITRRAVDDYVSRRATRATANQGAAARVAR